MAFTASDWGQGRLLTGLSPGSSLTGFTAAITKDNLEVAALDAGSLSCLNGGGDWRFSTDINGTTQLPCEIVTCVTSATPANTEFVAWIRFPTYASGTREVYAFWNRAGQSQPAVGAAFGRNEVWQGHFIASHDCITNSTGGSDSTTVSGTPVFSGGGVLLDNASVRFNVPSVSSATLFTFKIDITYAATLTNSNTIQFDGGGPLSFFTQSRANERFRLVKDNSGGDMILTTANNFVGYGTRYSISGGYDESSGLSLFKDGTTAGASGPVGTRKALNGNVTIGGAENYTVHSLYVHKQFNSADFVLAEYDNQNNPATFWTEGAVFVPGGGGSTITVIESLNNSNYVTLDPTILLTGSISITESLVNTNYTALNPIISFVGIISITESLVNVNYTALSPAVDFTGIVEVAESLVNSDYNALNATVTLTSGAVEIIESTVNTQYTVFNPSILLTPEPLGIVSTVYFNGALVDLNYSGQSGALEFNGQLETAIFNGEFNTLYFSGTIQTTCADGDIKTNC